jgi:hypothetical protein
MSRRHLMLAAGVALAAAVAGAPVHVAAAPPGSKNFTPPGYVPNYFSGEAQSFQGNATARAIQPGAGPGFAAPAPRGTLAVAAASHRIGRPLAGRAALGRGRVRLVHGRSTTRPSLHARAGRAGIGRARIATSARAPGPRVAQTQHGPARSKAVATGSRAAPSKAKSAARGHG